MPRQFLPRESGPHRIACIALYRSLLTHATRIPLPADLPSQGQINPVKHVVRKEFRRYVNHTSPEILVEVLQRGYAAEELFRGAANNDATSLSKIHACLHTLHTQREEARKVCLRPPPRIRPRVWPYPSAPATSSISARPLPQEALTGKRIVPRLMVANGVPFLRTKKPQSEFLGRVLRDKAAQKQRRSDLMTDFQEQLEIAVEESSWDKRVRELQDEETNGSCLETTGGQAYTEGRWEDVVLEAKKMVSLDLLTEQKAWRARGARLALIEEEEMELLKSEREKRRQDQKSARIRWNTQSQVAGSTTSLGE